MRTKVIGTIMLALFVAIMITMATPLQAQGAQKQDLVIWSSAPVTADLEKGWVIINSPDEIDIDFVLTVHLSGSNYPDGTAFIVWYDLDNTGWVNAGTLTINTQGNGNFHLETFLNLSPGSHSVCVALNYPTYTTVYIDSADAIWSSGPYAGISFSS